MKQILLLFNQNKNPRKLDGTSTARSRNDASVIEQFYKPKQKKLFKFKFNCNPLTGSQNIVITSNFSYTYMTL